MRVVAIRATNSVPIHLALKERPVHVHLVLNLAVRKVEVLPKKRREFAKVLERKTSPVQYLLYGRLTRGGTQGADRRQANYLLTLELINIETGESNTVGTEVRKEFKGP